jgi:hypothetical protein
MCAFANQGSMGKLSPASKYSTHLFALPSFAESFGRVLDLAGATSELNLLDELGEAGEVADLVAIAADWAAIGEDFWAALGAEASREDLGALALLAAVLEELG